MLHKYNLCCPHHTSCDPYTNYLGLYCGLRCPSPSLKRFGQRASTRENHFSCVLLFLNQNLPRLIKYGKEAPIEMFAVCRCLYVKFPSLGTSACHPVMKLMQGVVSWRRAQNIRTCMCVCTFTLTSSRFVRGAAC